MSAIDNARRGAALLDEKVPGWAERINTEILDIDSHHRCILGQLFAKDNENGWGRYDAGFYFLFGDTHDTLGATAVEHGFYQGADWRDERYEPVDRNELVDAWIAEVTERVAVNV